MKSPSRMTIELGKFKKGKSMTIVEKEDTKDLMKSFENLPKESKRYIQGFLAGLETAERNREDKKDGDNQGSSINDPDQG
nr:MAG TPA: hypothetical protein [Caudoviricetes sp.]